MGSRSKREGRAREATVYPLTDALMALRNHAVQDTRKALYTGDVERHFAAHRALAKVGRCMDALSASHTFKPLDLAPDALAVALVTDTVRWDVRHTVRALDSEAARKVQAVQSKHDVESLAALRPVGPTLLAAQADKLRAKVRRRVASNAAPLRNAFEAHKRDRADGMRPKPRGTARRVRLTLGRRGVARRVVRPVR